MNNGEQNAVEAMLHLSKPKLSPSLRDTTSETISIPTPEMKLHQSSFQLAMTSPSTPCFSDPTKQQQFQQPTTISHLTIDNPSSRLNNNTTITQQDKPSRPKAMCLSALLTDDSHPSTQTNLNPLPTQTHSVKQQQQQQPPQTSSISPVSRNYNNQQYAPPTEPVTPPFSPVVLPSLSAAGLTRPPAQQTPQQQTLPSFGRPNERTPLSNIASTLSPQLLASGLTTTSGNSTRSTNSSVVQKKVMKRPYKKYYSNPTPSSHCHVCARTSKAVKFAVCARIRQGLCRKVTCYKCFAKFGWDWESAVDNPEWICVHCRGECPEERSQCYIYSRVNRKRESKRGLKKTLLKSRVGSMKMEPSTNVMMNGYSNLRIGNGIESITRRDMLENVGSNVMNNRNMNSRSHLDFVNRNTSNMSYNNFKHEL